MGECRACVVFSVLGICRRVGRLRGRLDCTWMLVPALVHRSQNAGFVLQALISTTGSLVLKAVGATRYRYSISIDLPTGKDFSPHGEGPAVRGEEAAHSQATTAPRPRQRGDTVGQSAQLSGSGHRRFPGEPLFRVPDERGYWAGWFC